MPASSWSAEDDFALRQALEQGDGQLSWSQIALSAFGKGGRFTREDCIQRWKILSKPKPVKGPWTADEDAALRALVDRFGCEKWVQIAGEMGTRSGKQCRERWHNHLDPSIIKTDWTAEEEALIKELHARIGPRWAEMAKHLPGRPDNSIKNFWNAMQAREKRERNRSVSSVVSTADSIKAVKAKAAATAAAVVVAGASGEPASPAPAMSRSTSTTSLSSARFAPYGRSSPMTKSRSESVSSLSAFSPLRSSTSIETLDSIPSHPSPYTPASSSSSAAAMARSQSVSAFGAAAYPSHERHTLPRYSSMYALPRDLAKEMVEPIRGDSPSSIHPTLVIREAGMHALPLPPPTTFRRPHANSSPPIPSGLHAWADSSNTPSPSSSGSVTYQPLHQAVETADAWSPQLVQSGQFAAREGQPMLLSPSGRVQPILTPLHIGEDFAGFGGGQPSAGGAASGYNSYEASPAPSSYHGDSRFASPIDMVDSQQHHLFGGGAGPLVLDASGAAGGHQLHHSLSQSSLVEAVPPAMGQQQQQHGGYYGSTGSTSSAPAPYIHPSHLATLDEQHVYDGSSSGSYPPTSLGGVDEFGQVVSPAYSGITSGSGSNAPSPLDSSSVYEPSQHASSYGFHSHTNSMDSGESYGSFASPAGGGMAYQYSPAQGQGEGAYYAPAPQPFELPYDCDNAGVRPNLLRRDTAPPAFHTGDEHASQPFPPSSSTAHLDPSFLSHPGAEDVFPTPTAATFAASSAAAAAARAQFLAQHRHTPSLPSNTPYPASSTPNTSSSGNIPLTLPTFERPASQGGVPGPRKRAFSRPTPPLSNRGLGLGLGTSFPSSSVPSSATTSPAAASPANSAGLAAPIELLQERATYAPSPTPSATSRFAASSEPMRKVYSSPMSEVAARWEGFRLGTGTGSAEAGSPAPSSGSSPGATAGAAGGGEAAWLPRSAATATLGDLARQEQPHPLPSSHGHGRGGSAGGAGLSVDEHGRAVLPI